MSAPRASTSRSRLRSAPTVTARSWPVVRSFLPLDSGSVLPKSMDATALAGDRRWTAHVAMDLTITPGVPLKRADLRRQKLAKEIDDRRQSRLQQNRRHWRQLVWATGSSRREGHQFDRPA